MTGQPTVPALRIEGLVKSFPSFQLGPLDLTVPAGSLYGLIGPNGAGKTTTIDLILGMGAEDGGTITVFGMDHRRDEVAVKRRIGYVSPEMSMAAWGTVRRLIGYVRQYYPTWDAAYCDALLRRFLLDGGNRISELSLGNRTRLNLVIALAHRPDLLLLDEPTTGLDAVAKTQLFREILDLMEEERRTVLISSHNLTDLERFTDRIGMISRGRLLLEGQTANLVERFNLVDIAVPNGRQPAVSDGIRIREKDNTRWRLLVDSAHPAARELDQFEILARTPVTLEELFVALVETEQ